MRYAVCLMSGSALSWAGGNVVARRAGQGNMLAYVVWASAFSIPPLLALNVLWPAVVRRRGQGDTGSARQA